MQTFLRHAYRPEAGKDAALSTNAFYGLKNDIGLVSPNAQAYNAIKLCASENGFHVGHLHSAEQLNPLMLCKHLTGDPLASHMSCLMARAAGLSGHRDKGVSRRQLTQIGYQQHHHQDSLRAGGGGGKA